MKKTIAILLALTLALSLTACGGMDTGRLRIFENGMPLGICWDTPMSELEKMIPSGQGKNLSDESSYVAILGVSFEGLPDATYLLVNVITENHETPSKIQLMVSGSEDGGQALYDQFRGLYITRFGAPEEPESPWYQTCIWETEQSIITMKYGFQTGNAVDFIILPLE